MLRFNELEPKLNKLFITFQYILCYGSTIKSMTVEAACKDFNTSYVTVQRQQGSVYFGSDKVFQYILCYGSTVSTF